MTTSIAENMQADREGPPLSAVRVVNNVEGYLDRKASSLVHISDVCRDQNVSRRTLHRAFNDVMGMGPVSYLRRRRLCAVRLALRAADPRITTIAEIAMQHGFLNLGRFSAYFRTLFGEYPSETFGSRYR